MVAKNAKCERENPTLLSRDTTVKLSVVTHIYLSVFTDTCASSEYDRTYRLLHITVTSENQASFNSVAGLLVLGERFGCLC